MYEYDLRLQDLDRDGMRSEVREELITDSVQAIHAASSSIGYYGSLPDPDLDQLLFDALRLAIAVNTLRQIRDSGKDNT